jgi:glutamate/tyrosine decarboxylase-like PLP-dependent enzyme
VAVPRSGFVSPRNPPRRRLWLAGVKTPSPSTTIGWCTLPRGIDGAYPCQNPFSPIALKTRRFALPEAPDLLPDPILFPAAERRLAIEDALTRQLAAALAELQQGPVLPNFDRTAFAEDLASIDFEAPRDLEDLLGWTIDRMQHGLVHINHRRYFGLFNPGPSFPAECADRIAGAFNPQLATVTTSPAAVEIENHVIRAVGRRAGFVGNISGHFTSNGSEANYTALLAALTRADPGFGTMGARAFVGQPIFYASKECHLAWVKIALMAGIGRQGMRFVDTDGGGRLDAAALSRMLAEDRGAGRVPVMIVATAGTTNAGMIDPLYACADIARNAGIWFHVDAAWGGAVIASERRRPLLAGIERADSITIDAHKWLSTTMGCGMFISPHGPVLASTFQVTADFMPSNTVGVDPFVISAQWSRRFAGLKLFLALSAVGWAGYARMVDKAIALAALIRDRLLEEGWTVVNASDLAVICAVPPAGAPAPRALVGKLLASGEAWVSVATFEGQEVVRACVSNGMSTAGDITRLLDALRTAAMPASIKDG